MKKKINIDRVFLTANHIILILLVVVIAYPVLYVVMASVSAGPQNMTVYLIPKRFTLAGYEAVFQYQDIWTGYVNSLINTVLQVIVSLTITMLCAYPLSRPDFSGRNIIMILCMITMYFSGGMIPTYLLVRNLGLLNSRWALILPGAMSVYNMIVMRTYIMSAIPNEIRESAQMDGCGNIRYLFAMVIPLSKTILAVIALFVIVSSWNSYFDAMIYVSRRRELYPLALMLREILVLDTSSLNEMDVETLMNLEERRDVMKYAVIVVSTLPVMVIYPFIQKFFVKGVMIGSVKG